PPILARGGVHECAEQVEDDALVGRGHPSPSVCADSLLGTLGDAVPNTHGRAGPSGSSVGGELSPWALVQVVVHGHDLLVFRTTVVGEVCAPIREVVGPSVGDGSVQGPQEPLAVGVRAAV